jgi:uncharacterized protein (TIGR04141 family)
VGLKMRFGVMPEDLVADIREIARVCAEENPHPALEFVEHIQPIADPRTERDLSSCWKATPSLDLPPWRLDRGHKEQDYNLSVPVLRDGYVCLDRDGVRNPLDAGSSLEICDLLGPDDELIGVKHASGSAPLSHLFSQMLVSTQSLLMSAGVRAEFAAHVAVAGRGRTVPEDFTPKKVVFGILLKDGQELTPDSLFPFSQVTLAHTARILRSHQIDVEVIGIAAQR